MSLPDLRETLVCFLGHSTLFEHIITHIAEHLKLLFTGESISVSTGAHNLEHLAFVGDHGCSPLVDELIIGEEPPPNGYAVPAYALAHPTPPL